MRIAVRGDLRLHSKWVSSANRAGGNICGGEYKVQSCDNVDEVAWYSDNSEVKHISWTEEPNGFDHYMSGNVTGGVGIVGLKRRLFN